MWCVLINDRHMSTNGQFKVINDKIISIFNFFFNLEVTWPLGLKFVNCDVRGFRPYTFRRKQLSVV